MEKRLFEEAFNDCLNRNFSKFSKYFDFQMHVFSELGTTIFEINKCQILEFHKASITLTNNVLERLLKLALIYNETGIGGKPIGQWNKIFEGPNKKYGSLSLYNSIESCFNQNLINDKEKVFLNNIIRELMRNGFSHADSSKILSNLPDKTIMFQGSFNKPSELKEVEVNQKIIPPLQAIQIENFAKETSTPYFNYVFDLIFRIESRLIEKKEKTCT